MTKRLLILVAMTSIGTSAWAMAPRTTPLLTHADSEDQREFQEVYTSINNVATTVNATSAANLYSYKRPALRWVDVNTVTVETGTINGVTSAEVIFPDGQLRKDATSSHIVYNQTRNASLTGTVQSGLRSGSQTSNTWYSLLFVKSQANTSDFVIVGDTNPMVPAQYAYFNSVYGLNGWIYGGPIRCGDKAGSINGILSFVQAGNRFIFTNKTNTASVVNGNGILFQTGASSSTLTWTVSQGMGVDSIPNNISLATWRGESADTGYFTLRYGTTANVVAFSLTSAIGTAIFVEMPPNANMILLNGNGNAAVDLYMTGFVDGALGIGSNPAF